MALCSLPIETMQCYLPSTHGRELEKLGKKPDVPSEYKVPNKYKNGREVFKAFFSEQSRLFPGVDGSQFYDCIRNGLLHQAQTKSGWKIRVKQARLCDPEKKVIDRDRFVRSLGAYFKRFLGELNMKKWDEDLWKNTRRKIWWLIQLSRSK